jgi:amino acid permease
MIIGNRMIIRLIVTVSVIIHTTTVVTSSSATTTTTTSNTGLIFHQLPRGGGINHRNIKPQTSRIVTTTTTTNNKRIPLIHTKGNHKNNKKDSSSTAVIHGTGTATIQNEIFNLIKGIVGVGVLSLPAGIGYISHSKQILIPSLLLITIIGILSAYGFSIIGKVCYYTHAQSYKDAWSRSINSQTSWIPALSITCKTFLACLALSMVLSDTFIGLLHLSTNMRTNVLLIITTCILLPLCWMKNLSALAPFSLLGILGMVYTGIAMTKRYIDGSYTSTGIYYTQIASHLQPNFGITSTGGWYDILKPSSLILVCMLSTAYMAHFNAPKFYHELYNNTLSRYYTVVASSFGISIAMIGYITAIGFLTFGSASSGLILNNYSSQDLWMSASRIAVAIALVFSYPLAFQGCRDGVIDLIQLVQPKIQRTPTTLNIMTVALLTLLTILAASLKDVSFVLALGGGTYSKCRFNK